jgi:hypothetical protein
MVDEGRLLGEHDVGQRFFLVREGVQVHCLPHNVSQKPFLSSLLNLNPSNYFTMRCATPTRPAPADG